MLATIIISVVLAVIVGLIIYRIIKNAKSGQGRCAGCAYAQTCGIAKHSSTIADCDRAKEKS
ncbi:MAG: FeoB-associated Cys-rich membrane protein [Candidatus Omnitrophota bacterium]|jgi:hypothetical protein|nr:FeoB-associated Cys-rich membrane protein [Anaerolineaceae bacterium]